MEVWNIVTLTFKLFMKKCNLCQNRQNKPRKRASYTLVYLSQMGNILSFKECSFLFIQGPLIAFLT